MEPKEKVFYPGAEDYQDLENYIVEVDWQLTINPSCSYFTECPYRWWPSKFAEYPDFILEDSGHVNWLDDAGYFITDNRSIKNYSTWGS
jgi:hypothetical protein